MGSRKPRQYYCRCGTHLAKDNTERQCARCQRDSRDKFITPPEVPAEFWETEQFEEAFAAQHIGRVFRAYRTNPYHYAVYGPSGISQTLLGQWLGLRQPQVSRIETGPPIPDLDSLAYWARVLRMPPRLLWFRLPENKGHLAITEPVASDLAPSALSGALELPTLRWASDLNEARQSSVALGITPWRMVERLVPWLQRRWVHSRCTGWLRRRTTPPFVVPVHVASASAM